MSYRFVSCIIDPSPPDYLVQCVDAGEAVDLQHQVQSGRYQTGLAYLYH